MLIGVFQLVSWLPFWVLYFETWHIIFNFSLPLKNIDITCRSFFKRRSLFFTVYRPTKFTISAPLNFNMCSCHGIAIPIQINVLSWFPGLPKIMHMIWDLELPFFVISTRFMTWFCSNISSKFYTCTCSLWQQIYNF